MGLGTHGYCLLPLGGREAQVAVLYTDVKYVKPLAPLSVGRGS